MKKVIVVNPINIAGIDQETAIIDILKFCKVKYSIKDLDDPTCPACGRKRGNESREVALFREMVMALHSVYAYCLTQNKFTFTRKEIKERCLAPLGENVTARFGDWKLFGGIVYKYLEEGTKKGHYGFNKERAEQFFANKLAIPTRVILYKDGREMESFDHKTISQIRGLIDLLDENGNFKIF